MPAGTQARRAARIARQHAHPAGHRGRPPLRDFGRHAVSRCRRLFFHEVSGPRPYVTGGTSNAEGWLSPPRQLTSEWKASANTCECCCAYNMLELSRHLHGWGPEARYFDYYEPLASGRPSRPRTRHSGAAPERASRNTQNLTEAHIVGPNLRVGAAGASNNTGRRSDRSIRPLQCRPSRFRRFEPPQPIPAPGSRRRTSRGRFAPSGRRRT